MWPKAVLSLFSLTSQYPSDFPFDSCGVIVATEQCRRHLEEVQRERNTSADETSWKQTRRHGRVQGSTQQLRGGTRWLTGHLMTFMFFLVVTQEMTSSSPLTLSDILPYKEDRRSVSCLGGRIKWLNEWNITFHRTVFCFFLRITR